MAGMHSILDMGVSLVPVFIFLAALIYLDTFKLIRLRSILWTIGVGCLVAIIAFVLNTNILAVTGWEFTSYSYYGAPFLEEILKAGYLVYLIRARKIGFMVDGAIYGFAIGAGFAFVENIYYLQTTENVNVLYWLIRGLGTAMMHGGTTAIVGIVMKKLSASRVSINALDVAFGLGIAVVIHSIYNHFFLNPMLSTLVIIVLLPALISVVFYESEKSTRHWLGLGLDTDLQLLEMIITGNIAETNIGNYFKSFQDKFRGEIIADMLCLVRIHVELSIRAKGILLMRSAGYDIPIEASVREKFAELQYLRKSIGKTGQLAVAPFLHTSSRDLWQIHLLEKG